MYLKGEPVEGELAVITTEQAREADYNLSPSRWVGHAETLGSVSIGELIDQAKLLANEARQIDERLFALLSKLRSA